MSMMNDRSGMNEEMVNRAIIGTGQYTRETVAGAPTDALVNSQSFNAERTLLLAAGSAATYQRAGRVALRDLHVPEPAPVETLPSCSPNVVPLLQSILNWEYGNDTEWLTKEIFTVMQQRGLRVPDELLPFALGHGIPPSKTTEVIVPTLGARGRWLSQFNKNWRWVGQFFTEDEGTLPPDAETLWQEGTLGQRREILRRLRTINPGQAREWAEAVWKQEKAEVRGELMGIFVTALSLDDEPFLEQALDDRGGKVRLTAALLLANLPDSAFAQRMRQRASSMLKRTSNALTLSLTTTVDKAWERDGITARPPSGERMGAGAWIAMQVLSLIPPSYWEEQFQCLPEDLLQEARAGEWEELLLKSWSYAAMQCMGKPDERWCVLLWQWWCEASSAAYSSYVRGLKMEDVHAALGGSVQAAIEGFVAHMPIGTDDWSRAVAALPRPWSQAFGDMYANELHAYIAAYLADKSAASRNIVASLPVAVRALPYLCFEAVLADDALLKNNRNRQPAYYGYSVESNYATFADFIRLRKRFVEEM